MPRLRAVEIEDAAHQATTAELKQKAGRPLDGGLRITKAQAQLRTPLRGAEAGLRAMREALAARVPDA